MNAVGWFFTGALVGLANVYTIARTVSRIRPEARLSAVIATVGAGLLRFVFAAVVLSLALQQNVSSGILAFGGMLMARWSVVYLINTERLAWVWSR